MIKKLFAKHETLMCIALILIYVAVNSLILQNHDTTELPCALVNTAFSAALLVVISLGYAAYISKKP